MKLALVLATSAGGVGRHVHDLAAGLVAEGHEVLVVCPPQVQAQFAFTASGAGHLPIEVSERPHPARDVAAVGALRRVARGADVVHAHGLRAGALTALAMPRGHPPLVVTVHNATPGGRLGAVYGVLERLVARRAALVLGVSADLVDRQVRLGAAATGLAVVPAPPPAAPGRTRSQVRSDLGLADTSALAVVVARLAPQKGLDLLLDAVTLLGDRVDLVTALAGDGPLRAHLAARVASARLPVRVLGHRADVPDLVAAADIVVSSAVWEGQPVGLQEALHAGAPIVATAVGGTAAVLGAAGVLVPAGDPQALADAICDVLGSSDLATDLRQRARARAAELPTRADAVAAALAAYQRVGVSTTHGTPTEPSEP